MCMKVEICGQIRERIFCSKITFVSSFSTCLKYINYNENDSSYFLSQTTIKTTDLLFAVKNYSKNAHGQSDPKINSVLFRKWSKLNYFSLKCVLEKRSDIFVGLANKSLLSTNQKIKIRFLTFSPRIFLALKKARFLAAPHIGGPILLPLL